MRDTQWDLGGPVKDFLSGQNSINTQNNKILNYDNHTKCLKQRYVHTSKYNNMQTYTSMKPPI